MNFILKNKLYIKDFTKDFYDWCCQNLVFDNPEYIQRERMGKWTGNIERKIVMFERNGNDLILPFGIAPKAYRMFRRHFGHHFGNLISPIRPRQYRSNIQTREYQERAIRAILRGKNGILVAPCGSGKTQMGLEIAARIGGKTLWLTHTQDLLNQSLSRSRECFDIPASEFGTITAGKVNIGNTITFATVQTMNNIDLSQYVDTFDVIIVDECHHLVGSPTRLQMFYRVLSALSARYKIGLTATPYRADGLDGCMFAVLGDILHEVKKEEVEDNTCHVKVKTYYTGYTPNLDIVLAGDGTIVYSSLINDLTENARRNEKISTLISNIIFSNAMIGKTSQTIVLSDRVEHLKKLKDGLQEHIRENSIIIDGSMQSKAAKERRKEVLRKLNDGEIEVVFATYKLAKEGLDVPNLRYVVFASPIKDKTTVTQAAGRVARKSDGKEYGTIIDFSDNFGLLRGYKRKRKSIYKKLKYEIID